MPAKKAAKPDVPVPAVEEAVPAGGFRRNYLWPILGGLAAAVIPVLSTNLVEKLSDGVQAGDWAAIGAAVGAAGLGYFLTILQRHGGTNEPWRQPVK